MGSLSKKLGIGSILAATATLGLLAFASGGESRSGQVGRPALRELTTPATLAVAPNTPIHHMRAVNLAMSQQRVQTDLYKVPAGSRLVIEYVSFSLSATAGGGDAVLRLRIGTTCGGILAWHDVSTLHPSRKWIGESKVVKIFADAGSNVSAIVEREFSPPGNVQITFSGHLEPMGGAKPPGIG